MDRVKTTLPFLTKDIPGIGGVLRSKIEDFQVEEIPAYQPCGEGDHIYAWIEKRKIASGTVVQEMAQKLSISDRDIGMAGMKDKYAVTRQMISLPPPITPEQVEALEIGGVKILNTGRHGNKLRTGHLRGNIFILRLRDLHCSTAEAQKHAEAVLEALSHFPGAPNWYGAQRFGRDGRNAEIGKALVTQSKIPGKAPRGRQRRLYISAYQSKLFNEFLAARMQEDLFTTVLDGEVLQKRDSGGMFVSEEQETDQQRFEEGQLSLTGPMFGHKMKCPRPQSKADLRESSLLHKEEIQLQSFAHLTKLAKGTRRPLSIQLEDASVSTEDDSLIVRFTLPAGTYATAIMRELIKGENDFPE